MKRARRSDRAAVEAILCESYPAVHRIAHALAGEPRLAQRVVRAVLRRAIRVMPRWRKGITPENWFYHHALLLSREVAEIPESERDLLVTAGPTGDPAYRAFIRALRGLPRQQMEAFVLNHGEKLNSRLLGVAMDCSTIAAATHLDAGTSALKTVSVEMFPALAATLERAYATLTPPQTLIRATVSQQTGAVLWTIRFRRLMRRIIWLAILGLLAYAVWHWHALLLQWIQAARSNVTTRNT
jgi:DNA-directed RNA polymerase specialized sigma24 family protein